MKTGDTADFVFQHLVAAGISFMLFFGGSILLVFLSMIIGNDPGGPLFFPIFILLTLFGAVCICAVLFGITAVLQIIRRWLRFSWWVPIALVFPLTFVFLILFGSSGSTKSELWLVSVSGIVSIVFGIYWLTLCRAEAIISLIKKKWKGIHHLSTGYHHNRTAAGARVLYNRTQVNADSKRGLKK